MGSFKIGDKVRCVNNPSDALDRDLVGKTGEVMRVFDGAYIEVKWNDWGLGWGKSGAYWNISPKNVVEDDAVFKTDDKVRIKERHHAFAGSIGTVVEDRGSLHSIYPVIVRKPDGGNEPFAYDDLERVEDVPVPEAGIFIVVVEKDGKLAPATTPKVYGTDRQAKHVADDMAKRHGGKFLVFRATYESISTVTSRSL